MLKKILVIGLVFSFFFNVGNQLVMNIWYHIANDSFEQAFCINKEEPKKKCHGSCMMKKINKAPSEKRDINPAIISFNVEFSSFVCSKAYALKLTQNGVKSIGEYAYLFNYRLIIVYKYFHPPK